MMAHSWVMKWKKGFLTSLNSTRSGERSYLSQGDKRNREKRRGINEGKVIIHQSHKQHKRTEKKSEEKISKIAEKSNQKMRNEPRPSNSNRDNLPLFFLLTLLLFVLSFSLLQIILQEEDSWEHSSLFGLNSCVMLRDRKHIRVDHTTRRRRAKGGFLDAT